MKRNKNLALDIAESESIAAEAREAQNEEARLRGIENPETEPDFFFNNAVFAHEAWCKRNGVEFKNPLTRG